jgi:hypothetical protein
MTAGIGGPVGVAVDASGNIYVANYSNNTVTEYAPAGGKQLSSGYNSSPLKGSTEPSKAALPNPLEHACGKRDGADGARRRTSGERAGRNQGKGNVGTGFVVECLARDDPVIADPSGVK